MQIRSEVQGTPEWLQTRLGMITGSGMSRLITSTGKRSTSAEGYINQLIAERITGQQTPVHVTAAMERGTELEGQARAYYEMIFDSQVQQVGFCIHDQFEDVGISPDGLIVDPNTGKFYGLEIKCPSASTQVAYLRRGKVPTEYVAQVQACIWVADADYWDFISWHPQMKPLLIRVFRDDDFIGEMAAICQEAIESINYNVKKLRSKQ